MYQLLILFSSIYQSVQHGYLAWPPNRSSLWRYGFDTPRNYNDNSLYCGGRRALEDTQGKCGVCGDPYNNEREHEANGKYASGIITERYPLDTKTITVKVLLTVNHKGYFDFRLCPHNNVHVPVRQECLDKFVLPIREGSSKYQRLRFYPRKVDGPHFNLTLEIPRRMICSQCVLQWRYRTENSWGMEPNGTGCMGCGLQEEFYNCADISIGMDPLKQDKNKHNVTQKTQHKIHYIKKPLRKSHGTTIKNNRHISILRNTQVNHPNSNLEMLPSNQLTETRMKTMRIQHVMSPIAVKDSALNPSSSTDFKTIGIPKTVIRNMPSTSKLTTRGSIRVAKKLNKTGKTFIFWRKVGKTNRIIPKYPRRKPQLRSTSPFIVSKQFTSTKPTPSFFIKKQLTTKRAKSSSIVSTPSTSTRTKSSPIVSKIPTSTTTAIVSTPLTSNQQPSTSILSNISTSTRPLMSSIVSKPVTSGRANSSSIASKQSTSTRANSSPIVSRPSTSTTTKSPPIVLKPSTSTRSNSSPIVSRPSTLTTTKSPPIVLKPSTSTRSNSSPIVSKPLESTRTMILSIVSKLSTSTTKKSLPIVSKPSTSTRSRSSPIVSKPSTSTRTKSSLIVSKPSTSTRTKSSSVVSKPPTLTTPTSSSVVSKPSTSTSKTSLPIVSNQSTNQAKSKSTRAQNSSSIVSKLISSKQRTPFVILSEPSMPLRPKLSSILSQPLTTARSRSSSSVSQPLTSTRPKSSSIVSKQLMSTRPKLSPAVPTLLTSIISRSPSIVLQSLTSTRSKSSSPVASTQLKSTKPNSSSVVSKIVSLIQPVPPFILSKTSMSTGPKMTPIVSKHLTSTRPMSLSTVSTPLVSTRPKSSSIVSEPLKSTTPHSSFIASKTMSPRQPASSFTVSKALTARRPHASFSMLNPSTQIVHLGNIKPSIPVSFRNFSSSNVNMKEIDINLLSNSIRSLGVIPAGYNSSRTFVLTPGQKTKTSFPMRKKYIIVRKASKGLNDIQNNPNPSNYIVRRRQIRIPKAMVQRLKAQDLLKHIQQKLSELRELRDFSGIKQ